jgi:hypothetical protein
LGLEKLDSMAFDHLPGLVDMWAVLHENLADIAPFSWDTENKMFVFKGPERFTQGRAANAEVGGERLQFCCLLFMVDNIKKSQKWQEVNLSDSENVGNSLSQ